MKKNLSIIVALLGIAAGLIYYGSDTEYVIYDCTIAEWHPDVPPNVRQECRKKLQEHIKEQQKKDIRNYI